MSAMAFQQQTIAQTPLRQPNLGSVPSAQSKLLLSARHHYGGHGNGGNQSVSIGSNANITTHRNPLHDTATVLEEVNAVIQAAAEEDAAVIERVLQIQQELKDIKLHKTQQYKEIIADITSSVEQLKNDVQNPLAPQLRESAVRLQAQKLALQTQFNTMTQQLEQETSRSSQMDSEFSALSMQLHEAQTKNNIDKIKAVQCLSLYRRLSNIVWDFTQPEKIVKGTFHFENPLALVPFTIDMQSEQLDDVDVADRLWSIMGAHWKTFS